VRLCIDLSKNRETDLLYALRVTAEVPAYAYTFFTCRVSRMSLQVGSGAARAASALLLLCAHAANAAAVVSAGGVAVLCSALRRGVSIYIYIYIYIYIDALRCDAG